MITRVFMILLTLLAELMISPVIIRICIILILLIIIIISIVILILFVFQSHSGFIFVVIPSLSLILMLGVLPNAVVTGCGAPEQANQQSCPPTRPTFPDHCVPLL